MSTLIIDADIESLRANGTVSLRSGQLGSFSSVQTGAITLTNGGLVDLSGADVRTTSFTLSNAGNIFNLGGVTSVFNSYTVIGADGADIITGGVGFGDTIEGERGDDTLNGAAGNDTLTGGADKDTIIGSAGNDRMIIDAQSDIEPGESYNGGPGHDTLDIETVSSINISSLLINANVEDLESSGAVLLKSGQLDKFIEVRTGAITLTNGGTANLTNATVSTSTFDLSAAGNLLSLAGVNDTSYTVNGAGGNDTITGGDGFGDTIRGGGGNDIMNSSSGFDRFEGGTGVDTANYSAEAFAVGVTLDGSTLVDVTVAGAVKDRIQDVENVTGGSANDSSSATALQTLCRVEVATTR